VCDSIEVKKRILKSTKNTEIYFMWY